MDTKTDEPVRTIMESLRLSCESEILSLQQKIDSSTASFKQSLSSIRDTARESVQCRGKYWEAKAKLREAEDDLVKAISVKNRKEAKRIALMDALMARKSRVEEIRRNVQEQRAKKDEYDEILSPQSSASKESGSENGSSEVQEAIEWYNKVLGFRVVGGHGVKFIFKNISLKHPNEEFSFTIRHADDTYTMLDCDPQLDGIKELIHELNRTNGLFKFVRIMRLKFQEVAAPGVFHHSTSLGEVSSTISASAPSFSMSTDGSDLSAKKNEHQTRRAEANRHSKKQNRGKTLGDAVISPGFAHLSKGLNKAIVASPGSVRRSPRVMVRK